MSIIRTVGKGGFDVEWKSECPEGIEYRCGPVKEAKARIKELAGIVRYLEEGADTVNQMYDDEVATVKALKDHIRYLYDQYDVMADDRKGDMK